jgi:hypothetical protein
MQKNNLRKIKWMFLDDIKNMRKAELIEYINTLREFIHTKSPFINEPVDFVKWVYGADVVANDYNPNKVAPPEMELLEISIMNDGYTQPIVTWPNAENKVEVIDGFHRNRVGKESKVVKKRILGYLPVVTIRKEQANKNDRIASTIRHNRARGKHQIDAMSEIVMELKNRNWKNERIARELGMDEDEILRLCQITGLDHLFTDADFSQSWESSDAVIDYEPITDKLNEEEMNKHKTTNTSDPERVFHTYEKWECHKAGFYASKKEGMTAEECEKAYYTVLSNPILFGNTLDKIIVEWKHSCEHYLTNKAMNRIAWLGQAAVCYHTGVPSAFSAGWNRLNAEQQAVANQVALNYLNKWMKVNGKKEIEMNDALSIGRQVSIY